MIERLRQVAALVAGARGFGERFFLLQRDLQIVADAVELRAPGVERIGITGVKHVSHGQADGIEIVLNAQQLERIPTVTVHHFALQFADAGKLHGNVRGVGQHGNQGDNQAEIETSRGSDLGWRIFVHAKSI